MTRRFSRFASLICLITLAMGALNGGCSKKAVNNPARQYILSWSVFYSQSLGSFQGGSCTQADTFTSAMANVFERENPANSLCIGERSFSIDDVYLDQSHGQTESVCYYSRIGLDIRPCGVYTMRLASGTPLPALSDTISVPCQEIVIVSPAACRTIHRGEGLLVQWSPRGEGTVFVTVDDPSFAHSRYETVPDTGQYRIPASWFDSLNSGTISVEVFKVTNRQSKLQGVDVFGSAFVTYTVYLELAATEGASRTAIRSNLWTVATEREFRFRRMNQRCQARGIGGPDSLFWFEDSFKLEGEH